MDRLPLSESVLSECPMAARLLEKLHVFCSNGNFAVRESTAGDERSEVSPGEGSGEKARNGFFCMWQGQYKDLQEHLVHKCPRAIVKCPYGCEDENGNVLRFPRIDLEKHFDEKCPLGFIPCPHGCISSSTKAVTLVQRDEMAQHTAEFCGALEIECPNGCCNEAGDVVRFRRDELKAHKAECPEEDTRCTFFLIGCTRPLKQGQVTEHMRVASEHHQRLLEMQNNGFRTAVKNFKSLEAKVEAHHVQYQRNLERLGARMMDMEIRLNDRTQDIEHR